MSTYATQDADGIDLMYPVEGGLLHYQGEPVLTAERYARISDRITAQRDAIHGTPCLVCGAPIQSGIGHDEGCICAPSMDTTGQ